RLHFGVGKATAVGKYSERIAFERTRRENVPLRHCQTPNGLAHKFSRGEVDEPKSLKMLTAASAMQEDPPGRRCCGRRAVDRLSAGFYSTFVSHAPNAV